MEGQEIIVIKDELEFFMETGTKIHASLLDGSFVNGVIIKNIKDNVYWIEEDRLGQVFLFLNDIKSIKEFKEKQE